MIILYGSVLIFNILAYRYVKRLTTNSIVHIWVFTCLFQLFFDIFIDIKYKGYWYVSQGVDWIALPAYTALIPPVNLLFIQLFPFGKSFKKKIVYIVIWEVCLLFYEYLATMPEPWGFFRYGWWTLWHSAVVNPLLLLILLGYYKFVTRLEWKLKNSAPHGPHTL